MKKILKWVVFLAVFAILFQVVKYIILSKLPVVDNQLQAEKYSGLAAIIASVVLLLFYNIFKPKKRAEK